MPATLRALSTDVNTPVQVVDLARKTIQDVTLSVLKAAVAEP